MDRFRNARTFLNVACYVLLACTVNARPLVATGLLKLITILVLTTLLTFVVIHSPAIARLVLARLSALRVSTVAFSFDRQWAAQSQLTISLPTQPVLVALFQRPPPIPRG